MGVKMVKKVLVVDDNPDVIFSVKSGLEESAKGYKVIGAESGEKCIEFLKSNTPDIILLDIMMPEMSGWQTFDKIKGNDDWKDIPIVFLSARTDNIAKNAGEFLADDFIEKPAKIPDLKKRIDEIVKK